MQEPVSLDLLLARDEDLLLCAPSRRHIELFAAALEEDPRVGVIDDRFPLLSNLNILENVTLPLMYHRNRNLDHATEILAPFLERLESTDFLFKRKEGLSRDQMLTAYLLRCLTLNPLAVAMIAPAFQDVQTVMTLIRKLHARIRLWVICTDDDARFHEKVQLKRIAIEGQGHASTD